MGVSPTDSDEFGEIVFVHGIGLEQMGADVLRAEWTLNVCGGLRKAGYEDVANAMGQNVTGSSSCSMAFYADLFEERMLESQGIDTDELSVFGSALLDVWITAAELDHQAQGVGAMTRSLIGVLAKAPVLRSVGMELASRFVNRALRQATSYFNDVPLRIRIRKRLIERLTPKTKVIVAHSLGSVVAYEVCRLRRGCVPHLITLGSPLGISGLITERLFPPTPAFPDGLRSWTNVAAKDDFVAATKSLRPQFPGKIPGPQVQDYEVDNGGAPHSASHYLSNEAVGRAVGMAVSSGGAVAN